MTDQRESDIAKIANILRELVFEGVPVSERAARGQDLDASLKKYNPNSKGYFTDAATKLYDDPRTRAAFIGSEEEQAAAIGQAAQAQIANVARQFGILGGRGKPDSMEAKLLGLIGSVLNGSASGMQQPEPEERKNHVPYIDGTKMGSTKIPISQTAKEKCAGIQKALVDFIDAREATPDGNLLIKTRGEVTAYKALNNASDTCDKHGLDFKHFGLQPNPKGQSRN